MASYMLVYIRCVLGVLGKIIGFFDKTSKLPLVPATFKSFPILKKSPIFQFVSAKVKNQQNITM